jgi:lipid-A-disaccharide synthase
VDIVERARKEDGAEPPAISAGAIPIGLLPGSRHHEIRRLLPLMFEAAHLIAERVGSIDLLVALASDRTDDLVARASGKLGAGIRFVRTDTRRVLAGSTVTLAASGSVLLEACLLDAPVVMAYRIDPASYWIAYHFLHIHEKLPHYALPNLLAHERIVPELVQQDAVPARMADEVCRLVPDAAARGRMRDGYRKVREALGRTGATRAIARDILDAVGRDGA